MLPAISVITVTFNSEATVEKTILSVLSQEYSNLEYIIIDGASTDGTMRIVEKYRKDISVIVSEPDKGISDAFNKGIGRATGEIIGIINSDDTLLPGALQTIAHHYSRDIDVYSGVCECWDERTSGVRLYRPDIRFDKLKAQYGIAHPSRFIRKDAYERFGLYNTEMKYVMDMDLLCRFYRQGATFLYIDKVLARFKAGGVTSNHYGRKKNDYRLFVLSSGGSMMDFYRIYGCFAWKQRLISLMTRLFGEDIRYKLYNSRLFSVFRAEGKGVEQP